MDPRTMGDRSVRDIGDSRAEGLLGHGDRHSTQESRRVLCGHTQPCAVRRSALPIIHRQPVLFGESGPWPQSRPADPPEPPAEMSRAESEDDSTGCLSRAQFIEGYIFVYRWIYIV